MTELDCYHRLTCMERLLFVSYCNNNYFKSYESNLDAVVYTVVLLKCDRCGKFVKFYNSCFKFRT